MISVAASVNRLVQPSSHTGRGMAVDGGRAAPFRSVDGTVRFDRLRCQCEARVRRRARRDQPRDVFANRGSVLEAVSGSAAGNPDVVQVWMSIDQEVAAGRVLVLT